MICAGVTYCGVRSPSQRPTNNAINGLEALYHSSGHGPCLAVAISPNTQVNSSVVMGVLAMALANNLNNAMPSSFLVPNAMPFATYKGATG